MPPRIPLLSLCVACACAAPAPRPFFGDERYLVLGVQPEQEADRLEQQLVESGHALQLRLRGQHFHALGFRDRHGLVGLVRVVTARGIVLALDSDTGDALRPAVRYRLLAPPSPQTHDADGDGFEEIYVERIGGPTSGRCVLVFRARDSGFVDAVQVPEGYALAGGAHAREPALRAPAFCDVPLAAPDGGLAVPDAGSPAAP